MTGLPGSFGIVVMDGNGDIRLATELGRRPDVQAAIHRQGLDKVRPCSALYAVTDGEPPFIILARRAEDAYLFLVHREDPSSPLFDLIASVDFAYEILNHFLSSPYEAITVVDADGDIRFMSRVHERFLGLYPGEAIGKPVSEVIENTRLHEVARTGKAQVGQVQEIRGARRVVLRTPVFQDGEVVGAIGQLMFKGPEQLHDMSRQIERLRSEVAFYRREIAELRQRPLGLDELVGESDAIRQLKADIVRVAPLDVPVLLVGESGTGKELAAHAIHGLSRRRSRPMVSVNSAALPATLVESELFGYEAGAFTGAARKGHRGKFELADQSTLFLDEVGDMPLEVQAKLLRSLEHGVFERVGGTRSLRSDFRLITATNSDLKRLVDAARFRLDLYYRISGVTLTLPPLRERVGDIPLLIRTFLDRYVRHHQTPVRSIHPSAVSYLQRQPWPGNVRQLLHALEQAVIFCDRSELAIENFRSVGADGDAPPRTGSSEQRRMRDTVGEVELDLIKEALLRHRGNKKRVAVELGISRSYLYKRLRDAGGQVSDGGEARRVPGPGSTVGV